MTSEEIAAFFARRMEAFARHDAAALANGYAEDCVIESRTIGRIVGRRAIEKMFRNWFEAFPDYRFHSEDLLIAGERVVQTFTADGTDTGGFMGLPPTRNCFRAPGIFQFIVKDHQIVRESGVIDFSVVLMQLAGGASSAVDGARLYRETLERARQEHELKIAAEIQRALAPERQHQGLGST